MPDKKTLQRARRDKEEGKASSTQAGEFIREEFRHIRQGKHGKLIDISLTVSPVKNAKGQIIGASKIARDITRR